jgi:hypothetical protein
MNDPSEGHIENLENLKTILAHFSEKIDEWTSNNAGVVLSISVVRGKGHCYLMTR